MSTCFKLSLCPLTTKPISSASLNSVASLFEGFRSATFWIEFKLGWLGLSDLLTGNIHAMDQPFGGKNLKEQHVPKGLLPLGAFF